MLRFILTTTATVAGEVGVGQREGEDTVLAFGGELIRVGIKIV